MAAEQSNKVILLVEDETIIAMGERMVLEKHGYDVLIAHSGEEAIETVGRDRVDLILMDIDLGKGIDGTQAAQRILETRDLPLVFMSSHTDPAVVEKTEGITSYGYILKNSGETVLAASLKMAFRLFDAKMERLQSERALRESEERWQFALEGADHGVWDLDLETNRMFVSKKAEEIYGYTRQDIDQAFGELERRIHPDDRNLVLPPSREQIYGELPVLDTEYRLRRSDGTYKWVSDRGKVIARAADGTPLRVIGTITDITRRKEAEFAVQESESRFRHLLEEVPSVSVQGYAPDGTVRYWNRASEAIYGYTAEEAIGANLVDLIIPDGMREAVTLDVQRMVETGVPAAASELLLKRKDGTPVPVLSSHAVVQRANGESEVFCIDIDLTRLKEVEQAIGKQLLKQSILLREVHHRIKNNIASVEGLLSIQLESVSSPEAEAALQQAIGRMRSISILYHTLLNDEEYDEASVSDYVESLLDSVFSLYPANTRITLEKRIADFNLDSKSLLPIGMIISELVNNVMKYAFVEREKGVIGVTLEQSGRRVRLIVQDNGNGLPDDFDANGSRGFGLQLVAMLSEQLGGSFGIGNYNGGTRSVVEFTSRAVELTQ